MSSQSHHYKLYGLNLVSNRRLELLSGQTDASPDLIVNWTTDASILEGIHLNWVQVQTKEIRRRRGIFLWRAETGSGSYLKLQFVTETAHIDFLLDPKVERLWIVHSELEPPGDLESYFVGPVMGCVLRLRGTVCLHASVVRIGEHAAAIVGPKKMGKSTTAAVLARLGSQVLSDDMAVLAEKDGHFLVHRGYPQVRLWPAAIASLYPDAEDLLKVYSDRDKRYVQLHVGAEHREFWPGALPLGAIYVLKQMEEGRQPYIEPVNAQEKIMTLVLNTFGSYVVTDELRSREFAVLARLCKSVPVRRLNFRHDLENLSAPGQTILNDLMQNFPSTATT